MPVHFFSHEPRFSSSSPSQIDDFLLIKGADVPITLETKDDPGDDCEDFTDDAEITPTGKTVFEGGTEGGDPGGVGGVTPVHVVADSDVVDSQHIAHRVRCLFLTHRARHRNIIRSSMFLDIIINDCLFNSFIYMEPTVSSLC